MFRKALQDQGYTAEHIDGQLETKRAMLWQPTSVITARNHGSYRRADGTIPGPRHRGELTTRPQFTPLVLDKSINSDNRQSKSGRE